MSVVVEPTSGPRAAEPATGTGAASGDGAAARLRVVAPLSGQVWSLERIPDPVFAQKMVGDGLSIDPTDALLLAPCDGRVVALHAAGHAVTIRTPEGIELLAHIGIDTVALKGEGFRPR